MPIIKVTKFAFLGFLTLFFLNSCNGKLPIGDARKFPDDPALELKKTLRKAVDLVMDAKNTGGVFEFASSNELWRASLDVIDLMPLSSVNYSGGVIISDWYSSEQASNESIKVSIRFLTNEIRSDALDIKVFNRKCDVSLLNCKIIKNDGLLVTELKRKILKKAAVYKKEGKEKKDKEN